MQDDKQFNFGCFRLDEANECLWNDSRAIPLRPKIYAVLRYLVTHPGILVTKQQLLDFVWPDTFVSDTVLKDSIRQLREALGDDAKSPQFIETAHRRGYRFIAAVTATEVNRPVPSLPANRRPITPRVSHSEPVSVLGREGALSQMHSYLERAISGDRQIVFVTGETGIGKTALVEAFIEETARTHNLFIGRGQCLEQYGAGEAYLPILDALSYMIRQSAGNEIVEYLGQYAPTWLIQMPAFCSTVDRVAQRQVLEHADACCAKWRDHRCLATDAPLLLLLEDLHWSDYSTLDLVSYRRPHSASVGGNLQTC